VGQSAEELRADIARTRDDMTVTIDSIGDRVSPRRVARRRTDHMVRWARSARSSVMGSVGDVAQRGRSSVGSAGDRLQDVAGSSAAQLRSAPGAVAEQARGNPLAAGLVAFGVGLIVGSLPPASAPEQQLVSALGEKAGPVVANEARESAGELAQGLKGSAQDALDQVSAAAREAAGEVKEQVAASAGDVKSSVTDS
jgi:ElaB/YqjD/DUF883 family membrane-anchored ribosome-binding protein